MAHPLARMKGDLERKGELDGDHFVSLPPQALAVLKVLWPLTGNGDLLFPSNRHMPFARNATIAARSTVSPSISITALSGTTSVSHMPPSTWTPCTLILTHALGLALRQAMQVPDAR